MAAHDAHQHYVPFPTVQKWSAELDTQEVDAIAARLQTLKKTTTPEAWQGALDHALRIAAIDTGAIEGLYETNRGATETMANATSLIDYARDTKGSHVAAILECALRGYELVLDAVTYRTPLSAAWVRQVHATLCAEPATYTVLVNGTPTKRPLPLGEYKELPNNPTRPDGTTFHYAPPADVPAEMARLIDNLHSAEFQQWHPVIQAAYAHYGFVRIHPFADGNGRVARALASLFLYRSPRLPLVMYADQKPKYLDALEAADAGQYADFNRFIHDCAADAGRVFELKVRERNTENARKHTEAHAKNMIQPRGYTVDEADHAVLAVLRCVTEISSQIAADYRDGGEFSVIPEPHSYYSTVPPAHYRSVPQNSRHFIVESTGPHAQRIDVYFVVWPVRHDAHEADFMLHFLIPRISDDTVLESDLRWRHVNPTVGEVARSQLHGDLNQVFLQAAQKANADQQAAMQAAGVLDHP